MGLNLFRKMKSPACLGLSALLVVSGCGNHIAGSQLDEGGFGNPTMQNTQVHNGEIQVLQDLSTRFNTDVQTTINFAFNSARIDSTAAAVLRQQAAFMRQYPEVRFSVFGHTDAVGSDTYNQRLGERRARAVVSYLGRLGVSTSRLDALVSFGERQPLVVSQGRERANRRTITEVAGFVSDRPIGLDGRVADRIYRIHTDDILPLDRSRGGTDGIGGSGGDEEAAAE